MIHPDSTLALLGGAGKAGRPLVQEALRAGYRVRLLLRHPDRFDLTHERLAILPGDACDATCLRELLRGSSALLSTLGNSRENPAPILATVTGLLVPLLREAGIRRYVTVTSLYETSHQQPDEKTRQATEFMGKTFPLFMADRRREMQLLAESDLDYTLVRLPYVVPEPATGRVMTRLDHLPGERITAEDLARFLVEQLDSLAHFRQAPFVANG